MLSVCILHWNNIPAKTKAKFQLQFEAFSFEANNSSHNSPKNNQQDYFAGRIFSALGNDREKINPDYVFNCSVDEYILVMSSSSVVKYYLSHQWCSHTLDE